MRSTTFGIAFLAYCAAATPLQPVAKDAASASVKVSAAVGVPVVDGKLGNDQIMRTITRDIELSALDPASAAPSDDLVDEEDDITYDASLEAEADVSADASDLEKRQAVQKAKTFRRATIMHHNFHRANHSSPNIVWNASLAVTARKIARGCVWAHKMDVDGGGYGQNLAVGLQAQYISNVISDLFYNGEVNYYNNAFGQAPDTNNFEEWGHMTQVVWARSRSVGCAVVDCRATGMQNWPQQSSAIFTVCNYYPPGNYNNAYAKNVRASKQMSTITGERKVDRAAIAANTWPGKNVKVG